MGRNARTKDNTLKPSADKLKDTRPADNLQKVAFWLPKDRQSHAKRPSFETQKMAFRKSVRRKPLRSLFVKGHFTVLVDGIVQFVEHY